MTFIPFHSDRLPGGAIAKTAVWKPLVVKAPKCTVKVKAVREATEVWVSLGEPGRLPRLSIGGDSRRQGLRIEEARW